MIDLALIPNYMIQDPSKEVGAIKYSFENIKKSEGYYKPFMVLFQNSEEKDIAISSRPVANEQDYFTAISEMLFLYSSLGSSAVILALDISKLINNQEQDCLEIFIASDEACFVYHMPYIQDGQEINWIQDQFKTFTVDNMEDIYKSNSTIEMSLNVLEMIYLHTHLKVVPFEPSKVIHYLSMNSFSYAALSQKMKLNQELYLGSS